MAWALAYASVAVPTVVKNPSSSVIFALSFSKTVFAAAKLTCSVAQLVPVSDTAVSTAVLSAKYAALASLNFVSISVPGPGVSTAPFSSSNCVPSADNVNLFPLSNSNEYSEPSNVVSAVPFVIVTDAAPA